jgi:hypothetical protein
MRTKSLATFQIEILKSVFAQDHHTCPNRMRLKEISKFDFKPQRMLDKEQQSN